MEKPTKVFVKKVIGAFKRSKKKVLTVHDISRLIGIYPNIISENLLYFIPMIMLDPSINVRDYLPELESYVHEVKASKQEDAPKKVVVRKKELLAYKSINDFVYKKMTSVGGLVDTSTSLSDEDLAILSKLIKLEQESRIKKSRKHKKK